MKDQNRQSERFDLEDFRDQLTRRRLVLTTAVLGGGWIFTTNSTSEDHLTQAEDRFVDLARTLNDADITDPQQSGVHYDTVTDAIESVTGILEQDLPDDSQTEQRISALNAAIGYYRRLANLLDAAIALRLEIVDSEFAVLYHDRALGYEPENAFDTDSFGNSIVQFSEERQDSETVTSGGRKLVPNHQALVESLRAQRIIFDQHLTAQQTYLDTASAVETGIQAHEESQFDTACSTLTQARELLTDIIPNLNNSYPLSTSGLSLNQYSALLSLRQEGVSKLLDVSEASITEQRRQTVTNEALNLFFEARRFVTN